MKSLERRVEIVETKLDGHIHDFGQHVVEFKARGKNHEENARAMREIAERHNLLESKLDKLSGSMDNLANKLDRIEVRETTVRWVIKTLTQALVSGIAIIGGSLGILKYMGY